MPSSVQLHLCRPGFEEALVAEISDHGGRRPRVVDRGAVRSEGPERTGGYVFERQRLPRVERTPLDALKPIPAATAARVFCHGLNALHPWGTHRIVLEEDPALQRRLPGIEKALVRVIGATCPALRDQYTGEAKPQAEPLQSFDILQLVLGYQGLWTSLGPQQELLSPQPGGRYRMRRLPGAPSRSYLKVEEAIARMPCTPREGDTVVDLGAAPGGWSFAMATRGCRVTAVDHGSMRIPGPEASRVQHLKADGLTYDPGGRKAAVDWMLSDMLISPGGAIGLLRKWMTGARARYIICNVKLPQQQPWSAVKPLLDMLKRQRRYTSEVRQLFHDRREVTVMARRNP